jgi:hypothetical protein
MQLVYKMLRTPWATATNGDQGDSGLVQFSLDVHKGSSLLPCEHSAEMAEEGKYDAPIIPQ